LAKNYPEATNLIPAIFSNLLCEKNLENLYWIPDHLNQELVGKLITKKERLVVYIMISLEKNFRLIF